jgi:hypothetical protein
MLNWLTVRRKLKMYSKPDKQIVIMSEPGIAGLFFP